MHPLYIRYNMKLCTCECTNRISRRINMFRIGIGIGWYYHVCGRLDYSYLHYTIFGLIVFTSFSGHRCFNKWILIQKNPYLWIVRTLSYPLAICFRKKVNSHYTLNIIFLNRFRTPKNTRQIVESNVKLIKKRDKKINLFIVHHAPPSWVNMMVEHSLRVSASNKIT